MIHKTKTQSRIKDSRFPLYDSINSKYSRKLIEIIRALLHKKKLSNKANIDIAIKMCIRKIHFICGDGMRYMNLFAEEHRNNRRGESVGDLYHAVTGKTIGTRQEMHYKGPMVAIFEMMDIVTQKERVSYKYFADKDDLEGNWRVGNKKYYLNKRIANPANKDNLLRFLYELLNYRTPKRLTVKKELFKATKQKVCKMLLNNKVIASNYVIKDIFGSLRGLNERSNYSLNDKLTDELIQKLSVCERGILDNVDNSVGNSRGRNKKSSRHIKRIETNVSIIKSNSFGWIYQHLKEIIQTGNANNGIKRLLDKLKNYSELDCLRELLRKLEDIYAFISLLQDESEHTYEFLRKYLSAKSFKGIYKRFFNYLWAVQT